MGNICRRANITISTINDKDISLITINGAGSINIKKNKTDHYTVRETEDLIKKDDRIELIKSTITEL